MLLGGAVRARRRRLIAGLMIASLPLAAIAWTSLLTPSLDRDWAPEQARAATITFDEDDHRVTIDGVRAFRWSADGSGVPAWTRRTVDLDRLRGVELIVAPFGLGGRLAHTMLGFHFEDDERLVLSIEARRERGEAYGIMPGLLNRYELIDLWIDESDALTLRAVVGGGELFAFPARPDPERHRALLLGLLQATDTLATEPRFYDTVRDNCTTEWLKHVDALRRDPIGWRAEVLLPGRIGELMHDLGLMDTELDLDAARARFRIDEAIRRVHAATPDLEGRAFSEAIRAGRTP